MRTHPARILIATVVTTVGLLLLTVFFGGSPTLGLDLQGGIAVNLQPVEGGEVTDDVTDDQLDQAIEIIRRRVDALGVAEPEVSRQGTTISVQLPGAKDQEEVLDVVGKTARLEFRPVLAMVGTIPTGEAREEAEARAEELREELGLPEGVTAQQVFEEESARAAEQAGAGAGDGVPSGAPAPDVPAPDVPEPDQDTTTGNGGGRSALRRTAAQQEPTTTAPPAEQATTTTVAPEPLNQWGVALSDERFAELYQLEQQLSAELTAADERTDEGEVTLMTNDGTVYRLGPVALDGTAVESATAGLSNVGEWTVNPVFRSGEEGIDKFNQIAASCYAGAPNCPDIGAGRGQLAIVLDDEILSAPQINTPSFSRDQITISGSFDRDSAEALAVALRFGSLPIELAPQQAETVSATLGQGALQAGIIAGLIGLAFAAVYMIAYYRLLALVAIGSLAVSASALWVIMSLVGATVTLAGVVGIVVSVGVTVDSTVVYLEGLKEFVKAGSSVRAAVDRSFTVAYSTILKANIASLIGAGVLYWLAIGPVRGFAFYLGAMTLLNLIATYVFVYPATAVIARSRIGQRPQWLGIPASFDDHEPSGGSLGQTDYEPAATTGASS
jgi:preprotein translocase subunit SecD